MTTLITMCVYFDLLGEIKSISPTPNPALSGSHSIINVPLHDVEDFLIGIKNPFDYCIKLTNRTGAKSYKIVRKEKLDVNCLRSADSFLTEIPTLAKSSEPNILIENSVDTKKLTISINSAIRDLLTDGTDDEMEKIISLINTPFMHLFFTRKNDPYYLLKSVTISPKDLFDKGTLHLDYTEDLVNVSLFTKKLVDRYSYISV